MRVQGASVSFRCLIGSFLFEHSVPNRRGRWASHRHDRADVGIGPRVFYRFLFAKGVFRCFARRGTFGFVEQMRVQGHFSHMSAITAAVVHGLRSRPVFKIFWCWSAVETVQGEAKGHEWKKASQSRNLKN